MMGMGPAALAPPPDAAAERAQLGGTDVLCLCCSDGLSAMTATLRMRNASHAALVQQGFLEEPSVTPFVVRQHTNKLGAPQWAPTGVPHGEQQQQQQQQQQAPQVYQRWEWQPQQWQPMRQQQQQGD